MKKTILILTVFATIFSSCKKDSPKNSTSSGVEVKRNYVVKIEKNNSPYKEYTYSGSKIIKISNYSNMGNLNDYTSFTYRINSLLTASVFNYDGELQYKFVYHYPDNITSNPDYAFYYEDEDTGKISFSYENNKLKSWKFSFSNDTNTLIETKFYWNGNNIQKREFYYNEDLDKGLKLEEYSDFEYDNKKNPLYKQFFYFAVLMFDDDMRMCSENNIIKRTTYNSSYNIQEYSSYRFSNIYNGNGEIYKASKLDFFTNDTLDVQTFIYQTW